MRRQSGLSSLISGFLGTYNAAQEIQRRDDDADFQRGQRERTLRMQGEEDNLRASMKDAAAPATVDQTAMKSDDQDNRDVGQPGEAAPTPTGFSVKGKTYATMAEAQGAADAYNAPDQMNARMSQALLRGGKPAEAAQLRAAATQEKVSGLQLSDLERQHANQKFDDALAGLGSFDDIAGFTKTKPLVSADGKSVSFQQVGADGTTKDLPYRFSNDAKGLSEAKSMMSKSLPEMQKLSYLHQQFQEGESKARWEKEYKLREDGEKRRAMHEDRMFTLAKSNADAKADALDSKLPGAVKLQADGLRSQLGQINGAITKAQAEGTWNPEQAGTKQLMARQAALQLGLRTLLEPYLDGGQGASGADPLGLISDGGKGGAPAAAPAAASKPSAAQGAPTAAKDTSRAAPEAPGIIARMTDALRAKSMEAQQQGAEYQALQKLVNEARNGGRALSAREQQLARQYGIS